MIRKILAGAAIAALGASTGWAATGVAKIKGTADGSALEGTVTLTDTKDGLKVTANLSGVPANDHGFHIHEFGSCEDAGKAAGGHYNPLQAHHGNAVKSGMKKAHAGDLGNITAGGDGKAVLEAVLKKVTLTGGKYSVAGRAIVVHEKADDFGQPAGNAGGRIGCGIIAITGQ